MTRPTIGITCDYDFIEENIRLHYGYYEGILKAGGLPFLIPIIRGYKNYKSYIYDTLRVLDGIMLTGGQDIDPFYFNEGPIAKLEDINPYRDELEIPLCQTAMERDMPILGICRGIQVMNVAMGGTIYQDMESQLGGVNLQKHSQQAPNWYGSHGVALIGGTKIESLMGTRKLRVNSYHHQSIKDVAQTFVVSGVCEDKVIEAIESPIHKFAIGVQWHPEKMWERNPIMLNLFKGLVEASKIYRH